MDKVWVTSDLHLNHENIIKYCSRPFVHAQDMNQQLISNWNGLVDSEDLVIVTGDLCMGQVNTIPELINRLNGRIFLVPGNHDTKPRLQQYKELSPKVYLTEAMYYFPFQHFFFVFCHLPISNPDLIEQLQEDNKEIVWVSGHSHDKGPFYKPETNNFNICVDQTNYHPIQLTELVDHLKLCRILKEAADNGKIKYEKAYAAMSRYSEPTENRYTRAKGGDFSFV